MDSVKIYISSQSLGQDVLVSPRLSDGKFAYSKNGKHYDFQISNDIVFRTAQDYNLLLPLLDSECEEVELSIHTIREDDTFEEFWSGSFTMFNCKHSESKCFFQLKPKNYTDYDCVIDGSKREVNAFSGTPITCEPVAGIYGYKVCTASFDEGSGGSEPTLPTFGCLPFPVSHWFLISDTVSIDTYWYYDPIDGYPEYELRIWNQESVFHREIGEGTCSSGNPVEPTYGSDWNLVGQDCSQNISWWSRRPNDAQIKSAGPYKNGRLLQEFIQNCLDKIGCGLTVKSDFLGMNAVGDAPQNDEYQYATDHLQNLIVYQKSDVKRKNADEQSSEESWNVKLSEVIDDLKILFFVNIDVEDGKFIIEHESFFTKSEGLSLVNKKIDIQYDFSGNEQTQSIFFYGVDDNACSQEFKADPIEFDCGDSEDEKRLKLFGLDLAYIEDENNSNTVSDSGFVLIGTTFENGKYVIENNNSFLKFSNLHSNLSLHSGLYKTGKVNGSITEFTGVRPYRKLDTVSIILEDGEEFDPRDEILVKVNGNIQKCEVESGEIDIFTSRLTLDLKF